MCATASAVRGGGAEHGYLHYVGVRPKWAGYKLGFCISCVATESFRTDSCTDAVLNTDPPRLAALKTYLRIGYRPQARHEAHVEIWKKVVEETRISEAVRKGTPLGKGKKKLISNAIISNLIDTFNKSYKPNVGTINTAEMEKLLKLTKGELAKLMSNIDKPYPKEKFRITDTSKVSRIDKAAALRDILNREGISYYKAGRGDTPGKDYRFVLDPDKKKAKQKFKKLEKSKTFGFPKKTFYTKYPKSYKQDITTISKQSDEYKKFGYGRDRNTILLLGRALNNSLRKMSDKELYKFVDNNPKLKNLVTAFFNAKTGLIKPVPLKDMDMQFIRFKSKKRVDIYWDQSMTDLRKHLESGPVIILIEPREPYLHWIMVNGYDSSKNIFRISETNDTDYHYTESLLKKKWLKWDGMLDWLPGVGLKEGIVITLR